VNFYRIAHWRRALAPKLTARSRQMRAGGTMPALRFSDKIQLNQYID
jgi:hypothetical protein